MEEENQQKEEIIYASVILRLTSFILDLFLTNIIFVLILYGLSFFTKYKIIQQISSIGTINSNTALSSSNQLLVEFVVSYVVVFGLYNFFLLLGLKQTLGMKITGIRFVTSDSNGNPKELSIPQKFLRGFIGNFLSMFLLFIPSVVLPFDKYRRSFNDILSSDFVIDTRYSAKKEVIAYIVVAMFVILYFFLFNGNL